MKYLRVRNWHKFQTGRRSPNAPWIKLHSSLLTNHEFCTLPDGAKWMLIAIWILTGCRHHWVPMDARYLHDICRMKRGSNTHKWVDLLISRRFLEVTDTDRVPEREIEREREIETPSKAPKGPVRISVKKWEQGFEQLWKIHPRGPKQRALKAYLKHRPLNGEDPRRKWSLIATQLRHRLEGDWKAYTTTPHLASFLNAESFDAAHVQETLPLPEIEL